MSFEHGIHVDRRAETGLGAECFYRFVAFHEKAFEPFNAKPNQFIVDGASHVSIEATLQ